MEDIYYEPGVWIVVNGMKIFCNEELGMDDILAEHGISMDFYDEAVKKRNEAEQQRDQE